MSRAVQLVLAGNVYDVLVARLRRVDVGIQDGRPLVVARRQVLAAAIDDSAAADEAEAALLSHAVDGGVNLWAPSSSA